jgi:hypothetical protein
MPISKLLASTSSINHTNILLIVQEKITRKLSFKGVKPHQESTQNEF